MTVTLGMMVRLKGRVGRYEVILIDASAGFVRLKGPGRRDKRTRVNMDAFEESYVPAPSAWA